MSLRGKGSTLGAWKFSKLPGSKFTLVFLVLQPRSDTIEGYNPLVGAALLCRHIYQPPWSAEAIGGVVFPQTTPTPFVPLEKPMEVGRCACITAQLQLEHW